MPMRNYRMKIIGTKHFANGSSQKMLLVYFRNWFADNNFCWFGLNHRIFATTSIAFNGFFTVHTVFRHSQQCKKFQTTRTMFLMLATIENPLFSKGHGQNSSEYGRVPFISTNIHLIPSSQPVVLSYFAHTLVVVVEAGLFNCISPVVSHFQQVALVTGLICYLAIAQSKYSMLHRVGSRKWNSENANRTAQLFWANKNREINNSVLNEASEVDVLGHIMQVPSV